MIDWLSHSMLMKPTREWIDASSSSTPALGVVSRPINSTADLIQVTTLSHSDDDEEESLLGTASVPTPPKKKLIITQFIFLYCRIPDSTLFLLFDFERG